MQAVLCGCRIRAWLQSQPVELVSVPAASEAARHRFLQFDHEVILKELSVVSSHNRCLSRGEGVVDGPVGAAPIPRLIIQTRFASIDADCAACARASLKQPLQIWALSWVAARGRILNGSESKAACGNVP